MTGKRGRISWDAVRVRAMGGQQTDSLRVERVDGMLTGCPAGVPGERPVDGWSAWMVGCAVSGLGDQQECWVIVRGTGA